MSTYSTFTFFQFLKKKKQGMYGQRILRRKSENTASGKRRKNQKTINTKKVRNINNITSQFH